MIPAHPTRHTRLLTRDGTSLEVIAQGPSETPPVILLHGLGDSYFSWLPLLAAMPAHRHVVAFSQRGHGRSACPSGSFQAADFATDVACVLDSLGHSRAHVVGHSLGAWVALHLAARWPERVSALSLIGAFARFAGNPAVTELADEIALLDDPVDAAFVRGFQQSASAPGLPSLFFDEVLAESAAVSAHVWKACIAALRTEDLPADLSSVAVPTRLIWGDADPFVPRSDQAALLDRLAAAQLTVIAGAGHSPHWEDPGAIASILDDPRTLTAITRNEATRHVA
jgi:pimeloyl-ACP methyl ester carboxylesterase